MRTIIIHNQKCYQLDELLDKYENPYEFYLGIREINPKDIISFSLTEKVILTTGKLKRLKENVRLNGWQPIGLGDFDLLLFPNGKYSVYNGGNHRAYLSKQLKLEKVFASISVLIDRNSILLDVQEKIDKLEKIRELIYEYADNLNKNIYNMFPEQPSDEELKTVSNYFKNIDFIHYEIKKLLIQEALRLGYLTKELYNEPV